MIILISLFAFLVLKNNNIQSGKNFYQTTSSLQLITTSSSGFNSKEMYSNQQIVEDQKINFKRLVGYIRGIYDKDGKIYMKFDETSDCISEAYEVAKAMAEDGKCLPNVTFEEVLERLKNAPFSDLTELCPNQYFGYGVGYCYFRNTSTETVTFEIHPEVIVLYNIHPYDFKTRDQYKGAENYQISLKTFREDYYPKDKSEVFEIKVVNNVVFAITEYFVPRE